MWAGGEQGSSLHGPQFLHLKAEGVSPRSEPCCTSLICLSISLVVWDLSQPNGPLTCEALFLHKEWLLSLQQKDNLEHF